MDYVPFDEVIGITEKHWIHYPLLPFAHVNALPASVNIEMLTPRR